MPANRRWNASQANAWYARQPYIMGCNFVPSSAVNILEMWQRNTFDPACIDRELGWAAEIGMNSIRVNFQFIVWQDDPAGQIERFDTLLAIAARHGISVMPGFFDDCCHSGRQPKLGKQDDPKPGVHNSQWVPSPPHAMVTDPSTWGPLKQFVTEIVSRFAHDERIVAWDLYNEPGNKADGEKSLPLLEACFDWARSASPDQPLTTGVWNDALVELSRVSLELSDIVTFHNYNDLPNFQAQVERLRSHDRPILCTEWLRRIGGSVIATHVPWMRQARVGWYNWGLVSGRTQTIFAWGTPTPTPEPPVWFHDLLRADGTPYNEEEVAILRAERDKV